MEAAGIGKDQQQQRDDLVLSFCRVTSADREEALFYLESHDWIINTAVVYFYEQEYQEQLEKNRVSPSPKPPSLSRSRSRLVVYDEEEDQEHMLKLYAAITRSTSAREEKKPSGRRSNIRTFADLGRGSEPGSDSDDEPQGYYTGREKRQMRAMPGHFESQPSLSSGSFTGISRLLSGETMHQPSEITSNIYFWSDGFTVDDGPLRMFEDPENASFLLSIADNECPEELVSADENTMVKANLLRMKTDYPVPGRNAAAFQGEGRLLGSGSSSSDTALPSADNVLSSSVGLSVDDSKPLTSIQLKLADGTRMVARFNTHHTVGDIRSFIDSRPKAARMYQLQTVGFPPKQLNDLSKTIQEAGLANSVIIQRL